MLKCALDVKHVVIAAVSKNLKQGGRLAFGAFFSKYLLIPHLF
jgi:hypothetical protein